MQSKNNTIGANWALVDLPNRWSSPLRLRSSCCCDPRGKARLWLLEGITVVILCNSQRRLRFSSVTVHPHWFLWFYYHSRCILPLPHPSF